MSKRIKKDSPFTNDASRPSHVVKKLWENCKKMLKNHGFTLLSLSVTPFVIFVSTSVDLYLNNYVDLDNKIIVLLPFVLIFIAVFLIGCVLYRLRQKHKIIKLLLSVYYGLGPLFLFYVALRKLPLSTMLCTLILLAALSGATTLLYRRAEFTQVVRVFAWLAIVLIASQAITSANKLGVFGRGQDSNSSANETSATEGMDTSKKPNIYHILLDEYQTDMFNLTLTDEVKKELGGFTYYPETTTVYGRTGMSLPTIFTGNSYDYKQPQVEFEKRAFNSDKSFLYWLKESGYNTTAYIHKVYTFDLPLFDQVVEHRNNTKQSKATNISNPTYMKLFANLWLYANAPKLITDRIASPEFVSQIQAQNVVTDAAPILSQASFTNIINDRSLLDRSGSYVFAHLLFPHFPYVTRPDCTYTEGANSPPDDQAKCATKLIIDFLQTLKKLDRYDDSLIIIQSDHGARFSVENNSLVNIKQGFYSEEWSKARSRSLLLIKAPGNQSTDTLQVSSAKTSLLDIAPTLLDYVGINSGKKFEGHSLVGNNDLFTDRVRYYHFFDKTGKNDQTDKLHRYIIDDNGIRLDSTIPINN